MAESASLCPMSDDDDDDDDEMMMMMMMMIDDDDDDICQNQNAKPKYSPVVVSCMAVIPLIYQTLCVLCTLCDSTHKVLAKDDLGNYDYWIKSQHWLEFPVRWLI